ncbi:hypothetical protein BKA70DRAFT_1482491 [Coprinopsis sp. MPI-PUGE-AT-0042]|nr:hypothetical protein BKA70DRAFT_1482491 [Coprinopsis sp. MPI-PUGE-AT-0042]
MSALEITGFRLAPDDDYPLHITAKRYRPAFDDRREENEHQDDVLTLVVLHSTSFHKETWEPCLETMFRLAGARGKQFREAWAIESPNHGETAPWNTVAFTTSSYATQFGCLGYAKAVSRFLTKGPVSIAKKGLVGIGHSLGANTILLLHDLDTPVYFESLVLVEPLVSPGGISHLLKLRDKLVQAAHERQDIWPTKEDARRHLAEIQARRRKGKGKWDDRVLDKFADFGILPTDDGRVTLACTKEQEVSTTLSLVDPASGRRFATITYMPDVGHLVLQERPDELAKVITDALLNPATGSDPNQRCSKL